jgi:hypothetical protein
MSELTWLTTYGDLLFGAMMVAALIGLILQIRSQQKLISAQARHLEDLQGAVAAYGQSLIGSRSLLERLERRLGEFTASNLEIQSQFAFNRSFEEASRLVKDGTTTESLINDCGLSDAEAALMIRLHQRAEDKPRQQWRQAAVADVSVDAPVPADTPEPAESAVTGDMTSDMNSEEIRLRESLAAAQYRVS